METLLSLIIEPCYFTSTRLGRPGMGLFDAFRAPRPPPEESAPPAEILGSEVLQDQALASPSTSELLSNHEARHHTVYAGFTRSAVRCGCYCCACCVGSCSPRGWLGQR